MSDLIERQAAIDYFVTNAGWNDENGYSVEDSDELRELWTDLFNGVSSVPGLNWTPCSKKLPEESGEYYVTWTAPSLKGRRFIEIVEFTAPQSTYDEDGYTIVPSPDDEGEWETYDIHYDGVEILAWMALPNPYTGK